MSFLPLYAALAIAAAPGEDRAPVQFEAIPATAPVRVTPGDHFSRGVECYSRGDTCGAIEEFQKAGRENPGDAAININLGILYGESGKIEEALAEFDRVLAIDPGSASGHFNRGVIMMKRGRQAEAIVAFERALLLGGNNLAVHYNLGLLYEYTGGVRYGKGFDAARSIAHYRAVLADKPEAVVVRYNLAMVYLRAGDRDAAEKELDQVIAMDPAMADAHLQRGLLMLGEQNFHSAATSLRQAQQLDSRLPVQEPLVKACAGLGQFFFDNGDYEGARRSFEEAQELDPERVQLLVQLARCHLALGHHGEAADLFSRALSRDADLPVMTEYADACSRWGDALAAQGAPDLAVTQYTHAAGAAPQEGRYAAKIAALYAGPLGDNGRALYHYRKAIAAGLAPPMAEDARRAMARLMREEGGLLEGYRALVAKNPDNAILRYNLGVFYQQRGELDAAIGEYKEALARDPSLSVAHYNLGLAYQQKGMRSAALREYLLAIHYDPHYYRASYVLGRLYEEWGAFARAREQYERALADAPEYADAHLAMGLLLRDRLRDAKKAGEHLERYRTLSGGATKKAAPAAMP
ncbi:MAG: tetratricopeptide repeat protein [Candidatus Aureabacteria bacterium]|nr:tetratricopeptide repeat protein [Candidatus Auribacterota bacterium]